VATQLMEAFEQAVDELNLDLGDNPDDILFGTAEKDEATEAGDGPEVEYSDQGEASETDPSDDGESAAPSGPVIEVPSDGVLRLPDGTEVPVEKAVLLQADYTRKTQELAEQRRQFESEITDFVQMRQEVKQSYDQMRGWYEERASNPTGWIEEIVSNSPDPTATIAKALYDLAHAGRLDPAFVETFGIDSGEIAEKARSVDLQTPAEVAELRARLDQREMAEAQQYAVQHQAAVYQSQWDHIKQAHGLQFDNPTAEVEAKRELLNFALQSRLTRSLPDAYDLMLVRTGRAAVPKPSLASSDPEVTAKKKASRAVSRKGVGSSAGSTPRKAISTREAALMALDEFAAGA
jgi:uncharacterized protein YgiM (DUF1202 family)